MINRGEAIDDWTVQRASERSIKAEEQQRKAGPVEQQSPINFELPALKRRALDKFPLCLSKYKKSLPGTFKNTGTTIKFMPNPPETAWPEMSCHLFSQGFRFVGCHFHWSQQNQVRTGSSGSFPKAGRYSNDGQHKENGVFKGRDRHHDHTLSLKWPANSCEEVPSSSHLENVASSFIRYQGSLTTDPYTEGVIWTMFTDQLVITEEQSVGLPTKVQLGNFLDKFLKILG
ncbi:hypothetical protein niasHT_037158 [Heterodera trifolii]|uniref:carbonic anhydrase n=1 Tax=Heterodera trifolii TaxID=157864 RepID=A0ABD2IK18_9BILA